MRWHGGRPPSVRYDDAIRSGRSAGMSCTRIAAQLGLSRTYVTGRVHALGLPVRSQRRTGAAGLSEVQRDTYRLYRRKGFPIQEARSAALREAA
jgi:hypothetical protein